MKMKTYREFVQETKKPKLLTQLADDERIELKITYHYVDVPAISIDKILVKDEYRGQGVATEIMNNITYWADTYNTIITLTPENTWGSNKRRLTNFYKRFGFVMNNGKYKDYRFTSKMIRLPKK